MKDFHKKLDKNVSKMLRYKPDEVPKKPEKVSSKSELEKVYRFDSGKIVVSD